MIRNYCLPILATGLVGLSATADIIPFDLSPTGTDVAEGLSPANVFPGVAFPSTGSGGEMPGGITLDTGTNVLEIAIGYGSSAGFDNLTGPARSAHIHGPAAAGSNAGPLHDFFLAMQHLPGPDPADGGFISGAVTLTPAQVVELRAGLYYINIHTDKNPAGEIRGQLIELDNVQPVLDCPAPFTVECESSNGTPVTVTVGVLDEDGDPLMATWLVDGAEVGTEQVPSGGETTELDLTLNTSLLLGDHVVTLIVEDGVTDPVSCDVAISVVDTTAPQILSLKPSKKELWPPNHKMHPVHVAVDVFDACSEVTATIIAVESNEVENGIGDGNTEPDWEITGPLSVDLRAERSGPGDGRVYTLTIEVVDAANNSSIGTTNVVVPHDQGKTSKRGSSKRGRGSR